jgi:phosphatidylglycerol lysyltransferase
LRNALLFTLAYGIAGFYLLDRHFQVSYSLLAAIRQTVLMFTAFYNPGLAPVTDFARHFAASIYAVGAGALGYALAMLARPVIWRQPASAAERSKARSIVEQHGRTSLARFTLFDDKSYFFSPAGESVIAYVAEGRAAVALGDPIGPGDDAPAAITAFCEHCARRGRLPAFYQVLPDYLPLYQQAQLQAVCIGQEAIVPLDRFSLEGEDNALMRAAVERLSRLGQRAQMYLPPLSEELMDELQAASDAWLTAVRSPEKRFSVGWFDEEYVSNSRVMAVHTADGELSAFANIVPEYCNHEVAVDLMRHRSKVEDGTVEFLFVSLVQWAREQGYVTFNLGLGVLDECDGATRSPIRGQAMRFVHEHVRQLYRFKGLHGFKEKFHPQWSPRYLVFPGEASLPEIGLALARADAGDRFVRNYRRAVRR